MPCSQELARKGGGLQGGGSKNGPRKRVRGMEKKSGGGTPKPKTPLQRKKRKSFPLDGIIMREGGRGEFSLREGGQGKKLKRRIHEDHRKGVETRLPIVANKKSNDLAVGEDSEGEKQESP